MWEGSVRGTVAYAALKRIPFAATLSSAGVRAIFDPYAPTRSARSVSIVISTIPGLAGVDNLHQTAAAITSKATMLKLRRKIRKK